MRMRRLIVDFIQMSDGKNQKTLVRWRNVQCRQSCFSYLSSFESRGTFGATGPSLRWGMALRPLVVDFDSLRTG